MCCSCLIKANLKRLFCLRLAARKLEILSAAGQLNSLRVPPSNRLEKLKGERSGQQQHTDQRQVADLLSLEKRGRLQCGNN